MQNLKAPSYRELAPVEWWSVTSSEHHRIIKEVWTCLCNSKVVKSLPSPEAAEEVERKSTSSDDESVEEDLLDVLLELQDDSNQLDKL
ncbi:hypothetical protein D5086_026922 [Populus alba]|uniref:Uncharacterized protein n=1 Tax=Populus alba TaxID=43335 RepID=A0ACC4B4X8_POPAL